MNASPRHRDSLEISDRFVDRHVGPRQADVQAMLATLGVKSLDELIAQTVPQGIRLRAALDIPAALSEFEALAELRKIAGKNRVMRSLIGQGYYDCIVPPVVQRNILENPGWYTQYTPYQAEISQGRLEALINFQTMIADLTGLPLANASLLDEATAAAEAMFMSHALCEDGARRGFFVGADCHPQTIAVLRTRAAPLGYELTIAPPANFDAAGGRYFGVLLQYPATDGRIVDYSRVIQQAQQSGALVTMATDLLALTLVKSPGEWGADIAVGSAQRFGVPLGFGGPHAAFMATREAYKRHMPGRIIGVSRDVHGKPAYRLAIQTREQHIRREKATSNICTAQVLLAVMASMYAVYHGPQGLTRIARRVRGLAAVLARGLRDAGHEVLSEQFFDTLRVRPRGGSAAALGAAAARGFNLRDFGDGTLGISVDETTSLREIGELLAALGGDAAAAERIADAIGPDDLCVDQRLARRTPFLTHPVFNRYHSEHEMLRYIRRLESRDLSLTTSMISLGSCTMKLNATAEMFPVSWPEIARMHPYAPADQTRGYAELCGQLESWLRQITGFAAVSLQPNSGAQGEYAGLLAIRGYHAARGEAGRNVCLIPVSAHGTNPASAVIAGFRVVAVKCDASGNVDLADLRTKAQSHAAALGALMITYPSTHGVFEEAIREICAIVHEHGGLVYMDGANMNAQVGLCRPADIGADVCHLNLHKTFCIPHGGGGPGMGPIACAAHLAPFLPGDPLAAGGVGPVSAAAKGSASILPISWMYIRMMGPDGLTFATQAAILNANYMAARLENHYPILYRGKNGRVAHEFIIDCRGFEESAGIKVEDIAKRLMDYGFHAPTMSFPVPGTLMIEPTESESRAELDRFCDALIAIRAEIAEIEAGRMDREDNPLKHAPHTAAAVLATEWPHKYSREQAAYPAAWTREHKFWPAVGRIDNVWGDRNLFCTCVPVAAAE